MSKWMLFTAIALSIVGAGCDASPQRYLDKGNGLFDAGRYAEADLNYEKAIQKNPSFGDAYYRLGLSKMRERQVADAINALTHAAELLPQNDEVRIAFANACFAAYLADRRDARLYGQVESIAKLLLAKNPKSYDGLRLKGYLEMLDLHFADAIDALNMANAAKPMQAEVIEALTQCLLSNGEAAEAEKLASELIQRQPADGRIYDILYDYYKSNRRPGDAEAILLKKVENNPSSLPYRLELARHYAAANNRAAMEETLREATDNASRFPDVFAETGNFYASLKFYEDAQREYQAGMNQGDKNQRWSCEKGSAEVFIALRKWDEAQAMLAQMLKEAPGNPAARALRVEIDLDEGDPDKAAATVTELRALVAINGRDPALHYNLGRAYVAANRTDEALLQFNQTINLQPNYVPALVYAANVSLERQEFKEANQYANRLANVTGGNASARLLSAVSLIGMGDFSGASRELNRLNRENPNASLIKVQQGELMRAEKNYKEAENIFKTLYESDRNNLVALGRLMDTYYDQEKYDAAIQYLTGESRRSGSKEIQRMLADAALRGKKLDVAIQQYSQMAAAEPQNPTAHLRLGDAYLQAGRVDEALNQFETAKKLAPKDALTNAMLALALHNSGRAAEAERAYRDTLALESNNPDVKNNLAYLMAETGGNLDEALRLAQEAQRDKPQDMALTDTIGWIYYKKKNTDSAIAVLTNVVQKAPRDPIYHYHLAAALYDKGDKTQAKRELQAAIDNRPSKLYEARIRDLMEKVSQN